MIIIIFYEKIKNIQINPEIIMLYYIGKDKDKKKKLK